MNCSSAILRVARGVSCHQVTWTMPFVHRKNYCIGRIRECRRSRIISSVVTNESSHSLKIMSKRELGKLASVVDVDAPRAKRRREAVPQEEKRPNADMDVDVMGEANMKREHEDTTKLMQVKEQGLKLWQTVKDAVDKECVTDLPSVSLAPYIYQP